MTRQIRTTYRRHRGRAWFATIALLATAGLAVVLPAFASHGTHIEPAAQPSGVIPTVANVGGSNFSCSGFPVNGTYSQFQISKPAAGSYMDPATGVTFELKNPTGRDRQKFFSFRVVNDAADVYHVGVNGGTDTAWYNYLPTGVRADGEVTALKIDQTGLHATRDNQGSLYNASITTICYKPRFADIGGIVFVDRNQNGSYDTSTTPPDEPLSDWTVSLYRGGSLYGTPRTSGANGRYLFSQLPAGFQYTVCVTAPSGSGTWSQTVPTGNTACSSPLSAGHVVDLQNNSLSNDFGNVNTVTLDCSGTDAARSATTTSGGNTYTVQLAGGALCNKGTATYVFQLYGGDTRVADFHPLAGGGGQVHLTEKMEWTFSGTAEPDPANRSLKYDDIAPYGDSLRSMPYCLKDPRKAGGGELELDPANLTDVLPLPTAPDTTLHTSCLITSTESAGGKRTDISYSSVDGYRAFP